MKPVLILVGFLSGFASANAAPITAITGIRTASPTVLVAFFISTNVPPIWTTINGPDTAIPTNEVVTTNLSQWTLNGQPVTAANTFVTEAAAVEYHIYLQVPPLINGMAYTLDTPYGNTNFVFEDTNILCESIKVNQNGYSALSQVRYADLAIWLGAGGPQPITGTLPNYTVYNQFTWQPVASGTLSNLTPGNPDWSSGDYVYRMDLSGVPAGGPYVICVSGYGCSWPFGVGGDFSRRLGYVAFRALYYQRCGCPIIEPYAWANIRPYPCHTNIYDNESPDDGDNSSTSTNTSAPRLFVHGGYHDASNPPRNPYALEVPIILMTTYEAFPQDFTTNQFNIPNNFDSAYNIVAGGNGIPDLLNEVNWGVMLYTNLQSTPNEPFGTVAFGTASNQDPDWGINFDQDPDIYSTEMNSGWSCGLAAGAFMNYARLIQTCNPQLSAAYEAHAIAAYNAAGSGIYTQHKLYYNIQKYLLDGDVTASNNIQSLYTASSAFTNSYDDEAGGFANSGGIWMASYFMSYLLATNVPTNPAIVSYFKTQLQVAANKEVGYVNGDPYPVGWPTNVNPNAQNNWAHGSLTSQGEFAYPCLMEWAVTGQQQYINAASELMDYDQGLNPIGKCYLTGIGCDRVHNPEQRESVYAEEMEWGGPQPGVTVYGPEASPTASELTDPTHVTQIPALIGLPRERRYVDHLRTYGLSEFTDYQCEAWPAALYPVLAQGGTWSPAREPFLNPAASITITNGVAALQFGGLPNQTYVLQAASAISGPWTIVTQAGSVQPDGTGMLHFTDSAPTTATRFYRTQLLISVNGNQGPLEQVY